MFPKGERPSQSPKFFPPSGIPFVLGSAKHTKNRKEKNMSLAYFDDTAEIRIESAGYGTVTRTVERVKVDHLRKAGGDEAVMYVPLYNVRGIKYVDGSLWDESEPPAGAFTARVGDTFTYRNTGRNGATALAPRTVFKITEVAVNVRGSHRMRHLKIRGKETV